MYEKTMKEVLSDIWNRAFAKKIGFNEKSFSFTYNKNKETFLVTMYLEYTISDCDLFINEIRYEITNEKLGGRIVRHGKISKFKGFSQEKSFYNKIRKEVNTTIDIYTDEDRFKNYLNYSILSCYYKKERK
ncbi:hypothetical protein [Campylobacter coli]|uniref:hypothetical protein n=1 Tax=Campylobacter coli TaxID=195 RepID=UPI0012F4860F|nr:hypothetical protein [Campylobacter coli]EDP4400681.1 hypothetical protein [Campylobacter jejuni]MCE7204590.1 hypothetical protein [Campylobacter coli]MCE7222246.1 hypothetical protein [Campylobacter coli]HEH3910497.1 hypothetical protein [Campylobacter jejuni]